MQARTFHHFIPEIYPCVIMNINTSFFKKIVSDSKGACMKTVPQPAG